LGLGEIDQLEPFQISTNVSADADLEGWNQLPTAVQAVVIVHETPSSDDGKASTFGDVLIDQVLPFHLSTRVAVEPPFKAPALPTARQ
jgi:hypothetical protein